MRKQREEAKNSKKLIYYEEMLHPSAQLYRNGKQTQVPKGIPNIPN